METQSPGIQGIFISTTTSFSVVFFQLNLLITLKMTDVNDLRKINVLTCIKRNHSIRIWQCKFSEIIKFNAIK